jgi:hypothetical protein
MSSLVLRNELHESLFIASFVLPARRSRWENFIGHPRRRLNFLHTLADRSDLDERCFMEVKGPQAIEAIISCLKNLGAPNECYVISESSQLDMQTMELREAVGVVYGCGLGTVISCLAGELAYYEGEYGVRCVLHRRASGKISKHLSH